MTTKQLEIIEDAISDALNLLYDEVESVCLDELKDEYNSTIEELENAKEVIENELKGN